MISEKISHALNEQLNWEIYSSYVYLAMSSWFKAKNLNGFATWTSIQVREELDHAARFYEFIHEVGGTVEFAEIPKPHNEWKNPSEIFEQILEHEKGVTARINTLIDHALEERNHAVNAHLQWFISEQVEEESQVQSIIQQLDFANNNPQALFMIDRELGQRVYTPPSQSEQ